MNIQETCDTQTDDDEPKEEEKVSKKKEGDAPKASKKTEPEGSIYFYWDFLKTLIKMANALVTFLIKCSNFSHVQHENQGISYLMTFG